MTRRHFLAGTAAVCPAAALAASPQEHSGNLQRRILIVTGASDLPYHHWRETTASIRTMLDRAGIFDVKTVEEPCALNAAALRDYDAILLNYNGLRLGAVAEEAIEEFVRSGKGLIAFHQACYGEWFGMRFDGRWREGAAGDHGWAGFAEMIGCSWKPENVGHASRGAFPVQWKDPAHPVAAGLAPEFMANDELYHKLDLKASAHVLADAFSDPARGGTGRREPMIWTVPYGRGRVFFTTLGHDAMALYQPGLINALVRGAEWAAAGNVTLQPLDTFHRSNGSDPARVLAVTGGHTYPTSFYSLLNEMPDIRWAHAVSQAEIPGEIEKNFDVLLLHDMHDVIAGDAQARLKAFVEAGRGVVATHHAIVDYTSWPWWYEEVTGGKFFVNAEGGHKKSSYHEDVEFLVTPVKGGEKHPVLAGVGPLWVYDEVYRDMWQSPRIQVLMETDHPESDRPVVYIGPHEKARVLYVQLGHSDHTMRHPGYRRLLRNAVLWTARRT